MLTMTFKCAASVLTYALVMTNNMYQVNFVPIGPEEIACDGNTYKSFADATKKVELDPQQPTILSQSLTQQHLLPPGTPVAEAPPQTQQQIATHLLNNGTATVIQGDTVKGAYKCSPANS